jgi:hypothetical protein
MKSSLVNTTKLRVIVFGLISYGMLDLFIPYNSAVPLIAISAVGVILPLIILSLTNSSLRLLISIVAYAVFFTFVKLFFVFGPSLANYSDGKTSISYGTYVGLSPQSVNLRLLFIFALVITFAVFFAWVELRKKSTISGFTNDSHISNSPITKADSSKIWLAVAAIALSTPFLEGQVQGLGQITSALDFDSQQINAWFDFKSQGFVEMRDFWFPYGGMMWVQDGLLGIVLRWILLSTLIFMVINYFWEKSRQHVTQLSYLIIAVLLMTNYQIISIRYVFPLMSLLVFFNIREYESRSIQLTKSLPLAVAIWMSPEMSIFVIGLSVFGVVLLYLCRCDESYDRSLHRSILPIISFLILIFYQLQNGQLKNTLSLLINSREILEYSFSPFLAFTFNLSMDFLGLFRLSIVMLSLVILIRATSNLFILVRSSKVTGMALNQFFVGVYLLFLLQKEMSRGGMTLLVAILMGLAIALLLETQNRRLANSQDMTKLSQTSSTVLRGLSALTVLAILFTTPVGSGTFTSVLRAPQQAKTFLGDLNDKEVSSVLIHSLWDLENQKKLVELKNQFGPYFEELLLDTPYILGDRPDVYRALGKQPYWAISQYNLSPKSAQEKVLAEIVERNPKFVLVDRNFSAQYFDSFPSSLRNPIVYRHIIRNYVYAGNFGNIDLYQQAAGAIDLRNWRNLFGDKLDISALPLVVSPPLDCIESRSQGCQQYLKFKLVEAKNLEVKFNCGGVNYSLISSSNLLKRGIEYWFPLDNVWFWNQECNLVKIAAVDAEVLKQATSNELY